ncbi:MAG: NAD(P)-dependent oxidoreductase [Pseudomonadota bacterium]
MVQLAMTGATGFVGAATLERALSEGHKVAALARRAQSEREHVRWIGGTLADQAALLDLCENATAVIHIAGLTNAPDPAHFEAANVTGTANMIAAAKAAGIKRFVQVSSLSAREPQLSVYGASKARAEELVMASGLDWTIVRPAVVYGPRDTDVFELFRSAKVGLVPLPPRGATSIIHVDDLARLLVVLATGGLVRRKIFEPDDGREGGWSHQELAQEIGRAMGKRSVFAPHLPAGVMSLAARADGLLRGDKAKLTADRVSYICHPNWVARSSHAVPRHVWEPKISGEEGLKATAEWYRAQGAL